MKECEREREKRDSSCRLQRSTVRVGQVGSPVSRILSLGQDIQLYQPRKAKFPFWQERNGNGAVSADREKASFGLNRVANAPCVDWHNPPLPPPHLPRQQPKSEFVLSFAELPAVPRISQAVFTHFQQACFYKQLPPFFPRLNILMAATRPNFVASQWFFSCVAKGFLFFFDCSKVIGKETWI